MKITATPAIYAIEDLTQQEAEDLKYLLGSHAGKYFKIIFNQEDGARIENLNQRLYELLGMKLEGEE